jgi:hypothetical protein
VSIAPWVEEAAATANAVKGRQIHDGAGGGRSRDGWEARRGEGGRTRHGERGPLPGAGSRHPFSKLRMK